MGIKMHISVGIDSHMGLWWMYLYMEKRKQTLKEAALSVFSERNPWQQMILYLCVIYTQFILGVLVLCDLHNNKLLKLGNIKKCSKAPPWFKSIFLWNIQQDIPPKLLHHFRKTWKNLVGLHLQNNTLRYKKSYSPLVLDAFCTLVLIRERNAGLIFINDRFTLKLNAHHTLIFIMINIWLLFALMRWIRSL